MQKSVVAVGLSVGLLLTTLSNARAGHLVQEAVREDKTVVVSEFPFEKGNFEFQALAGAFASVNHHPDFDYAVGSLRAGWMLYSPSGSGFFRGNTEFLIEAFGAGIWEGPGTYMVGATLILRYNFVQPDSKCVPYFQIGAGGLYSDASKDQNQRLIGAEFEFNLQASLGFRWFCTPRCAFTLEAGYRHISNACLADRNVGVDSIGGQLGVSLFY